MTMKPQFIERRSSSADVSWFLDQNNRKQLDLNPEYQRRSVWSPSDRRYFLDTIFRGYPCPAIYLHKIMKSDGNFIYAVVDGKQRLETIIKFSENKISVGKEFGDIRLDGNRWNKIRKDEELARAFWDYVLPVEYISIGEGSTLLNEVFDRLNRNSRKLVDQELRHAKYDGWFIDFVESESENPDWEDLGVVTTARAKRMRDVQFLSELLIVLLKSDISGFDQNEIDEFYANYDEPNETISSFNEEDVKQHWTNAKRYLLDIQKDSNTVTTYARDFINLYTLWGLVALNADRLLETDVFAEKYTRFMDDVIKFKDKNYLEKVLNHEDNPEFPQSLKYYQNSTGASTEYPQRRERQAALTKLIFG